MKMIISVMLAFGYVSTVFAHPNHMNFETHNLAESVLSEPLTLDIGDQTNGHNDVAPCNEQHKKQPCKK